jgi:hypothetical protein
MRKIVLFIAALFFMAVPVMAVTDVNISCTVLDSNWVAIDYNTHSDTNLIRAFGLDITVPDGNIKEVNGLDPNYRIYPGQIDFVSGHGYGDVNGYGTPYALSDLNDANLTIEMGSLYTTDPCFAVDPCDPNNDRGYGKKPGKSGRLLKFRIANACSYTVDANVRRGGIVMEDPYDMTLITNLPRSGSIPGCTPVTCPVPPIVTLSSDDANAAILAATLTVGNRIGKLSCLPLKQVLEQSPPNGAQVTCGSPVDYNYSLYQAACPNVVTLTRADANNALLAVGLTVGTITDGNGNSTPIGSVYAQGTIPGTILTCGTAVNFSVAAYCMKSTHPDYAKWVLHNKPKCWCYAKQCRGDINGAIEGLFWVGATDKAIFVQYFNLFPDVPPPSFFAGACADLTHSQDGGLFWVGIPDKNIFMTYFNKLTIPPDCDATHINFWCKPGSTSLGCP